MLITENTQDAIVPKELWDRMQELRQRGIAASSALKEKECLPASPIEIQGIKLMNCIQNCIQKWMLMLVKPLIPKDFSVNLETGFLSSPGDKFETIQAPKALFFKDKDK